MLFGLRKYLRKKLSFLEREENLNLLFSGEEGGEIYVFFKKVIQKGVKGRERG